MKNEDTAQAIEDLQMRLDRLERNHLALSAEHVALKQFTRGILGFIKITPETAARRLPVFRENALAQAEDVYLDPTEFLNLFEAAWARLLNAIPPGKPDAPD